MTTTRAESSGSLVLGLDVGTQGTKGLLLDADSRRVVARGAARYGVIEGLPPGASEQHPDTWLAAVRDVAAQLLAAAGPGAAARVGGVGISGQQHGLVVLDEQRRVIRPAKLWNDTSTTPQADELSAALGRRIPVGFTASKILWLKRHEEENWRRVKHVLLPHDFLNERLTGRPVMEAGDASGTGFFDPVKRAFDEEVMAWIDPRLRELVPPLLAAGEPAGRLSPSGAALLGLREGLPVAAGGGDNMCSAIGSGATRAGVVTCSLGTSGTVFAYADRPVVDPEGLIAPFCDSTGGWLPLLCVMNCTNVTEEVHAAFPDLSLDELTRAAEQEPPGAGGLLWLPFLQGERVPDLPDATSTLLGLRGGALRPGRLFRAALEGVALNLGWGLQRLAALGLRMETVRLVGGGAHNRLWQQILADVFGVPVVRLAEAESGALGAAIQAGWTARRLAGEKVSCDEVAQPFITMAGEAAQPDTARAEFYREAGVRFRAAVDGLYGEG
ncbi:MAG TPA: xylulokinase [Planctomycetota bacterium]|nr:xylulokinase [Planctomycetota bacterium]